jgi:hypothetical protein
MSHPKNEIETAKAAFEAQCSANTAALTPAAARVKAASESVVDGALEFARTVRKTRSGTMPAVKLPPPSPGAPASPDPSLTGKFAAFK